MHVPVTPGNHVYGTMRSGTIVVFLVNFSRRGRPEYTPVAQAMPVIHTTPVAAA